MSRANLLLAFAFASISPPSEVRAGVDEVVEAWFKKRVNQK